MAVGVVVVLEVVDVEHREGHRVAGELRALELEGQPLAEEAVVVQGGERVGDGAVVRARDAPGQAAHALDLQPEQLLEEVGALAQELAEVVGGDEEDPRGAVGPHGRGAGLAVEGGHLPGHRPGVEVADGDLLAVRGLVRDLEPALEEEHDVVPGVALLPQHGPRIERDLAAERAEVGERARQALHEQVRPLVVRKPGHAGPIITPPPPAPYRSGREYRSITRSIARRQTRQNSVWRVNMMQLAWGR